MNYLVQALKGAATQLDAVLNGQGALDMDAIEQALREAQEAIWQAEPNLRHN